MSAPRCRATVLDDERRVHEDRVRDLLASVPLDAAGWELRVRAAQVEAISALATAVAALAPLRPAPEAVDDR